MSLRSAMSDRPSEREIDLLGRCLMLEAELATERRLCDQWRNLANGYDDIRGWLRLCDDDHNGHAEFYKEACLIIFGHYHDESDIDDPDE